MRNKSLELLHKITNRIIKGRGSDFLRPINGSPCDWFMFVPSDFNSALNIEKPIQNLDNKEDLEWSQGGLFSFSAGDVIYDTDKAYQNWTEALRHVRYCFQVIEASPVLAAKNKEGFRSPGKVIFNILKNNENKTGLVLEGKYSTTQDDFVHLLIEGSCKVVDLNSTQIQASML